MYEDIIARDLPTAMIERPTQESIVESIMAKAAGQWWWLIARFIFKNFVHFDSFLSWKLKKLHKIN